jgi:hypothetical protein
MRQNILLQNHKAWLELDLSNPGSSFSVVFLSRIGYTKAQNMLNQLYHCILYISCFLADHAITNETRFIQSNGNGKLSIQCGSSTKKQEYSQIKNIW